jgi:hypothetical protein
MSDEQLDDVTAQLAEVQGKLLDLPDDAFAERYALQKQQDALREQASQFAEDWDAQRPTDELLAELAARRSQLKAIEDQRIDMVSQSGGGSAANAPGADAYGAGDINTGIAQAQGLGDVEERIGRIKGILRERDVAIPPS